MSIKIGITGAMGRMGQALIGEILDQPALGLAGGIEYQDHPLIGTALRHPRTGDDAGHLLASDAEALFAAADVVIDFTNPAALGQHLALAARHATALVIGTTGLEARHHQAIDRAALNIALVQSANMSLGVNLLAGLVRQSAAALGNDWDIEIVEMHHRHKIDAPSGTALLLGEAAAAGRAVLLDEMKISGRDGITGPRPKGAIGFATLRGGNVAGDHEVIFAADDERLSFIHRAGDRRIFARGALRAATWVAGRDAGRYTMADVLGF